MDRNVGRAAMEMFCKLYSSIEYEKLHGEAGMPKKGRLTEVAADYLLALPDAKAWDLVGEEGKTKLANYLRNADSKARGYAAQLKDSANKDPVTVEKAYDFWDIAAVRDHYLKAYEHRQSARQASLIPEVVDVEQEEHELDIPVLSIADTTTVGTAAEEQIAAAGTMIKRRTSLGGAVNLFENTLTPLIAALNKRAESNDNLKDPTLTMRKSAFNWLRTSYFGAHKTKLTERVARNTVKGKALTFAIWAMMEDEEDDAVMWGYVHNLLECWGEVDSDDLGFE